jgi:putative phosphotransacetylase
LSLYGTPIPVAITARHVHLSRAHADALFGKGHALVPLCSLTQPEEFACAETVTVRGPDGVIEDVRVVGPLRERTSVELGVRDHVALGLGTELRLSSRLDGSPGCTLDGPEGTVVLAAGVLNALRHMHLSPEDAGALGLDEESVVALTIGSERARQVREVVVHIREGARPELHLDPEEANAADVGPTTTAILLDPSAG